MQRNESGLVTSRQFASPTWGKLVQCSPVCGGCERTLSKATLREIAAARTEPAASFREPEHHIMGLMEWLLPSLRGWPQTSGLVSRGIRGSPEGCIENVPNCPQQVTGILSDQGYQTQELRQIASRRSIRGEMVNARSPRLGSTPIQCIPADRSHLSRADKFHARDMLRHAS